MLKAESKLFKGFESMWVRKADGFRFDKTLSMPNPMGDGSPHQCLRGPAAPEIQHCPPAIHSNTPGSLLLPG